MPNPLPLENMRKSLALKYLPAAVLFLAAISIVPLMKPAQIPKLEEGTFRDESGSMLTVRNGAISFGGSKAPYDLWIGKGKRHLSTKSILGDLYVRDTNGKKAPAEIIIDNVSGAAAACTVRRGGELACFQRVR